MSYTVSTQESAARLGRARGFTLLELLIVIALLSILAVVVILVLNPAETLRKARDSQRLSDLSSVKSAIGLLLSDVASPDLDAGGIGNNCEGTGTEVSITFGSVAVGLQVTAGLTAVGTGFTLGTETFGTLSETVAGVDASGWMPINLGLIGGGSPLGSLPIDPAPTVTTATDVIEGTLATGDRLYIYGCSGLNFPFEIDTNLEAASNVGAGNREFTDGGNNNNVYEVGTNLNVIGTW